MTQKNIVYGDITAGGDIHIGDVIYNVQESFQHSILFLRIEPQEQGNYTAQLSLKSRHSGNGSLPAAGIKLLYKNIPLQINSELLEQVNAFQEFRRLDDQTYRYTSSRFHHLNLWNEEQLSQVLFDTFFQGDILQVCRDFVDLLEKRKIEELILAISSPATQILNLPFEMLIPRFFPPKLGEARQSLAVNHFGLVRSTENDLSSFDMQGRMASAAPLKMLFVTALPENLDEKSKLLEIEEEQKRLIDAIGTFEATGGQPKIVIEFLDTASLAEISEALKKHQHDILHISGHGSYKKQVKRGVLHLEDEEGNHCEVSGSELGETLRQYQCVKLLILSACETAISGDGVVEQLANYGLPAIVAMRFAVTDEGAKIFTTALYAALAKGESLSLALAHARESLWQHLQAQIRLDPNGAHLAEWYTPVVYLNQYCAALIDRQATYVYPDAFYPRSEFLKTKNTRLIGSGFIGRKPYLNQLRRSFAQGQHVVLHGLGGLGKTTLAEAFVHNYDNRSHQVLLFRKKTQLSEAFILNELLATWETEEHANKNMLRQAKNFLESDAEPLDKLDYLISNYLQNRKSILVFDNFEDVQQDEEGMQAQNIHSSGLASFIKYLCAKTPPHCHLLFTTRYVISDLQDKVLHLALDKMSYAESYRLSNFSPTLRQIPLQERQDVFKRLDGHPRAFEFLEVILEKDKNTNWAQLADSVGEVEAQIWEDLLLEKIYVGLTEAEQRVLQMAAVCIARTPLGALVAMSGEEEATLIPILRSLHEWSLCFWDGEVFEVHSLTREWVLKKVVDVEKVKEWAFVIGGYFKGQSTCMDTELARGYFEMAEAWEEFADTSFNLDYYYRLIGLYERCIELNQAVLIQNIDDKTNADAFTNIGIILKIYGRLDDALMTYERGLSIQNYADDLKGKGVTLNNIGQVYIAKGDYEIALSYLEQSLTIRKQIGDRQGECTTLVNIAGIYSLMGDDKNAIDYFEKNLTVFQQIGDRQSEGICLNNIGQIYANKGDYDNALCCLEQSLAICQQVGPKYGEGVILNNISQIHAAKKDYEIAFSYMVQGLIVCQNIGNKSGECTALNNIGHLFIETGNYEIALNYLSQALFISRQNGYRSSEGRTLNNIGQFYFANGSHEQALNFFEQSFQIQQQVGDILGIAATLNNIGATYWEQCNDPENAILAFKKSYNMYEQLECKQIESPGDYLITIRQTIGETRFQEILSQLNAS